ncbi:hypothetical protein GT204_11300 [Streptomyces sp. SID4919]|uniref:hypothetical protein n=1 Tax=unclassified Streptomyces TaxID=2593676 RepID=UPI0008237836|nr:MULTISPECIES: hypothetical protein [unclassified Streptomyces]MYY09483.1 hypothetical protein [Streptomyces sp. SID4919]SCK59921.1 LPXTG-motif cell wall anchor domain-containing protein [Streptomyces sp. AmelKG-E11A]
MKLRRAMAAAAATAVIGPVALLSAPLAHATGSPSATPSESAPASSPASTPPTGGPSDSTSPTASDSASSSASTSASPDPSDSQSTSPAPSDTSSGTSDPGSQSPTGPTGPGNPGESETSGGTDEPGTGKPSEPEPTEDPGDYPRCDEIDEDYEETALETRISGLPGKIVAGTGWHEFTLTTTNTSRADLDEVAFYAEVENFEIDDPSRFLSPYVSLQFFDVEDKEWREVRDTYVGENGELSEWAGAYFTGVDTMKPQDYVTSKLRLDIRKNAPAGDGYAFGSGGYLDTVDGQQCAAESFGTDAYFTVLTPGSSVDDPGVAKPGDGEGGKPKPGPATKPQGVVNQQPVTGNLAATGSSSALPMIGLFGGITVIAGGAAVFIARKRKSAPTAP